MPWPQLPTMEDIGTTLKGVFIMQSIILGLTLIGVTLYEVTGCASERRAKEAEEIRTKNLERIDKETKGSGFGTSK